MRKILIRIIQILQVLVIFSSIILEYLTKKKAGVMHHVYARSYQWESTYFSSEMMNIYRLISVGLVMLTIGILVFQVIKGKDKVKLKPLILTSSLSFLNLFILKTTYFTNFLSYDYMIMFSFILILLQILIVVFSKDKNVNLQR